MSIKATTWAWEQTLPAPRKLILLSLAENADNEGICWPSLTQVSKRTSQSVRTVQRTLKDLKQLRLLTVKTRTAPCGRQRSNQYQLCLSTQPHPDQIDNDRLPSYPVKDTVSLTKSCRGENDTSVIPRDDVTVSPLKPQQEPSSETKKEPSQYMRSRHCSAYRLLPDEQKQIAYLLKQFDKNEAEYLSSLLSSALSKGLIRVSAILWLEGAIRKRRRYS